MKFDPTAYWLERGKLYKDEERLNSEFHIKQREFIVDVVKKLKPLHILELGCGFGRITRELAKALPQTMIFAVDVSPDQIDNAKEYCKGLSNVEFIVGDINNPSTSMLACDLVLAVEVLLHIPPTHFELAVSEIFRWAKVLVHDYDKDFQLPCSVHVFNHSYKSWYESMGMKVEEQEQDGVSLYIVRSAA